VFHLGGLGRYFSSTQNNSVTLFGKEYPRQQGLEIFKKIIWLTYRADITDHTTNSNISTTSTTVASDAGWGCMIRAGQMMMAQALRRHSGADEPE
jgi:hypothetical protein